MHRRHLARIAALCAHFKATVEVVLLYHLYASSFMHPPVCRVCPPNTIARALTWRERSQLQRGDRRRRDAAGTSSGAHSGSVPRPLPPPYSPGMLLGRCSAGTVAKSALNLPSASMVIQRDVTLSQWDLAHNSGTRECLPAACQFPANSPRPLQRNLTASTSDAPPPECAQRAGCVLAWLGVRNHSESYDYLYDAAPRLVTCRLPCSEQALDVGHAGTPSDPENTCPKAVPSLCVSKHCTGFLSLVVDVKSFSHDEKNVNVVRREFTCNITSKDDEAF
jgi:hypothetical protein